jgi:hypothetical protein
MGGVKTAFEWFPNILNIQLIFSLIIRYSF